MSFLSGVANEIGTMSTVPYTTWTGNTVSSSVAVHPASLAKHPQRWTKDEVRVWLRWCSEEFSIETVPPDKFDMNGKALCLLARSDFMERLPRNGDVLYNCLQTLISKCIGGGIISQQCHPTASGVTGSSNPYADNCSSLPTDLFPTGLLLVSSANSQHSSQPPHSPTPGTHVPVRPYIPIQPRPGQSSLSVTNPVLSRSAPNLSPKVVERMSLEDRPMDSEASSSSSSQSREHTPVIPVIKTESQSSPDHEDQKEAFSSLRAHRSTDCRLLWEFIHQLLLDTKYSKYVCWENREDYVFRIANPTGLAELWGQQKNRTNMTYEKLSRALRYYYRMNIIRKVPGKRLTYKFLQPPNTIQKGQRGAKPHSKIHLPSTLPSVVNNEPSVKYEEESDYDSFPSDMDSPEHVESKSSSLEDSEVMQGEFERTNNTNMPHRVPTTLVTPSSINFPVHLSSYGQPSRYVSATLLHHNNLYEPSHASAHLQSHNEYYQVTDGLVERVYHLQGSNREPSPKKVIRPLPSYPPMVELPLSKCLKQESNLARTQSASSKELGPFGKRDHVLRLPIDRFYRSQSCELPVKLNELNVPYPGNQVGQTGKISPTSDFQSEPEDLSVKKDMETDSHSTDMDAFSYHMDGLRCRSANSVTTEYHTNKEDDIHHFENGSESS